MPVLEALNYQYRCRYGRHSLKFFFYSSTGIRLYSFNTTLVEDIAMIKLILYYHEWSLFLYNYLFI